MNYEFLIWTNWYKKQKTITKDNKYLIAEESWIILEKIILISKLSLINAEEICKCKISILFFIIRGLLFIILGLWVRICFYIAPIVALSLRIQLLTDSTHLFELVLGLCYRVDLWFPYSILLLCLLFPLLLLNLAIMVQRLKSLIFLYKTANRREPFAPCHL